MVDIPQDFGKPNPLAPTELAHFAFLIGKWRCQAKIKTVGEEWQTFNAEWLGRYILDGYAIADEYRMTTPAGKLIVLGMNFRSYDAGKRVWNIKWLSALDGGWTDLVSQNVGDLALEGSSITYSFKEPVAAHAFTRVTYTSNSPTHFTWRGEKSDDQKSWSEFMIVEAYRGE